MKTFFSDNDFKDGIGWGIISVLVIGFATNNGIYVLLRIGYLRVVLCFLYCLYCGYLFDIHR